VFEQVAEPLVGGRPAGAEPLPERLGVQRRARRELGQLGQLGAGVGRRVRPQGRPPELDRPQSDEITVGQHQRVTEEVAEPARVVLPEIDAADQRVPVADRRVRQRHRHRPDLLLGGGGRRAGRQPVGEERRDRRGRPGG
jgi:hypothetical protein